MEHFLLGLFMLWNTHKVVNVTTTVTKTTYATNADLVVKHLGAEAPAAIKLWTMESGLRENAVNSSSGACGIPQALPCSKMPCQLGQVECQIEWGYNYIKARYGTTERALNQELAMGWY